MVTMRDCELTAVNKTDNGFLFNIALVGLYFALFALLSLVVSFSTQICGATTTTTKQNICLFSKCSIQIATNSRFFVSLFFFLDPDLLFPHRFQ